MNTPTPERKTVPVIKIPQPDGSVKEVSFTVQRAQEYWAERARSDIKFFMEFVYGWKMADHQHEWFDTLVNSEKALIVSPPGFGKTDAVQGWLAWNMGHKPISTNMFACVNQNIAQARLGSLALLLQMNERYRLVFPWVVPDPHKSWSADKINIYDTRIRYTHFAQERLRLGTDKSPSCLATSVTGSKAQGGRISGLVVIDDPHDEKTALSVKLREKVLNWYYGTLTKRLIPNIGRIVIITTRWSEDDLAGTILSTPTTAYKTVTTYAETQTPEGERKAVWEGRFPLEVLDGIIAEDGRRRYNAYYMHKVGALTGAVFQEEWLKQEVKPDDLPEFEHIVISVDPSIVDKDSADFAALAVVGLTKKHELFVLDLVREHMSSSDLGDELETLYNRTVEQYGFCEKILVEKSGQQQAIINGLIKDTSLPIKGVRYPGNKLVKASVLETYCSNGKFYAKWWKPWGKLLRDEMVDFPNGKHDDMVDAIGQAANYLSLHHKVKSKAKSLRPGLLVL